MEYSHNGQALISTDKTGTIKYFTPYLTNIHGFPGHREACHGVGWSPNDERFVTGGDDGLVKIWSYREAREERILSGKTCFSNLANEQGTDGILDALIGILLKGWWLAGARICWLNFGIPAQAKT